MTLPQEHVYTMEDLFALPDGQRAELIDGQIVNMAPPSPFHQELVMELSAAIRQHIKKNGGNCKVYPAPLAVNLHADDKTWVEPDISVICDNNKINSRGCEGPPDWIIEIVSPSSTKTDYIIKLFKYRSAGVREYWIINPMKQVVQTYYFEPDEDSNLFSFQDTIPVHIFPDLAICVSELLE